VALGRRSLPDVRIFVILGDLGRIRLYIGFTSKALDGIITQSLEYILVVIVNSKLYLSKID